MGAVLDIEGTQADEAVVRRTVTIKSSPGWNIRHQGRSQAGDWNGVALGTGPTRPTTGEADDKVLDGVEGLRREVMLAVRAPVRHRPCSSDQLPVFRTASPITTGLGNRPSPWSVSAMRCCSVTTAASSGLTP